MSRDVKQMILGGAMLIVGWLILMGMVLEIVPSYIFLSLFAYALTVMGFMIGVMGALMRIRVNRMKDKY